MAYMLSMLEKWLAKKDQYIFLIPAILAPYN